MKSKSTKTRFRLLHQYYSYTGFYSFIWKSVKKVLPSIILILILVYVFNLFFDLNAKLSHLTEILPSYAVLLFFFVSEILLGLVPPEIFIAWSGKMDNPWFYLSILALFSYAGGLYQFK